MASPVVQQAIESSTNTAGTSHVVTLPTATAGQLLLIILDKGSTAATINAHASLTELLDENSANGLYIAYRWMDGSEPASYTLTSSASTRTARIAYRISGAANPAVQPPVIATTATGTSATPNPPSITPPSSKDYLFIAFYGAAGEEADDDTWSDTPPTNYSPTPPRQKACGTVGTNLGGMIAAAERQLTTGSAEDPGTFAKDVSAAWRAQTIIIHPTTDVSVGLTTVLGTSAVGSVSPAVTDVAVPWTDTFNRSELGAHWTVIAGTVGIVANALKASSAPAAMFATAVSSPPANVRAKATIKADGTLALYARVSGTVDKYVFAIIGSTNIIITDHDDAGAPVDLTVASTTGVSWSPGDVFELQVMGVVAEVFKNGVSILNNVGGTDLRLTAAGYSGIYLDSTTPEIDEFTIEQASVSVALTGVSRSGAVGSMGVTSTRAMTGAGSTATTGALAPSAQVAASGVQATGSVGTVTAVLETTVQLLGVAATSALGALQAVIQRALGGTGSAGAVGSLSQTRSVAATGVGASGATGTLTMTANVALAGSGASAQAGTVVAVIQRALVGEALTGYTGTLTPSIDTDITVQLTGVSATTSLGSLGASFTLGLTGLSASPSVGTIAVIFSRQATGIVVTPAVGSVAPTITRALTGASSTGAVGNLIPSYATEIALTGVLATGSVGSLSRGVTQFALSGVAAAGSVGNLTPAFAQEVALTGVAATTDIGSLTRSFNVTLAGQALDAHTGDIGISTGATLVALTGVSSLVSAGSVTSEFSIGLNDARYGVNSGIGATSNVTVVHNPLMNVTSAWTVECWMRIRKPLNVGAYAFHPFTKGVPGQATCGPVIYIFGSLAGASNGYMGFYGSPNGVWSNATNLIKAPIGRWFHIAGAWDSAGGGDIYLDGVQAQATAARFGNFGINSSPLLFAQNNSTTSEANIDTHDVRFWSVRRSQPDIAASLGGITGNETGLIGAWRLDEQSGAVAYDASPNALHGALSGVPMGWNSPMIREEAGSLSKSISTWIAGLEADSLIGLLRWMTDDSEFRTYTVSIESRLRSLEAQRRLHTVEPQQRDLTMVAESRLRALEPQERERTITSENRVKEWT